MVAGADGSFLYPALDAWSPSLGREMVTAWFSSVQTGPGPAGQLKNNGCSSWPYPKVFVSLVVQLLVVFNKVHNSLLV